MEVVYHPSVEQDIVEALRYYAEASPSLADEFESEVRITVSKAAGNPLRFHPVERGFRRANLARFPYHVLYEVGENSIRIMHLRHHKRHPDYNIDRK